jgi:hypothetical protein
LLILIKLVTVFFDGCWGRWFNGVAIFFSKKESNGRDSRGHLLLDSSWGF